MSTPPVPSHLAYWYQALVQEHGIKIRVPDGETTASFKQKLYIARRKALDYRLWHLAIVVPDTSTLWIVHQDAKDD